MRNHENLGLFAFVAQRKNPCLCVCVCRHGRACVCKSPYLLFSWALPSLLMLIPCYQPAIPRHSMQPTIGLPTENNNILPLSELIFRNGISFWNQYTPKLLYGETDEFQLIPWCSTLPALPAPAWHWAKSFFSERRRTRASCEQNSKTMKRMLHDKWIVVLCGSVPSRRSSPLGNDRIGRMGAVVRGAKSMGGG